MYLVLTSSEKIPPRCEGWYHHLIRRCCRRNPVGRRYLEQEGPGPGPGHQRRMDLRDHLLLPSLFSYLQWSWGPCSSIYRRSACLKTCSHMLLYCYHAGGTRKEPPPPFSATKKRIVTLGNLYFPLFNNSGVSVLCLFILRPWGFDFSGFVFVTGMCFASFLVLV